MFGLKSATALFVNRLREALRYLNGVAVFCDDIVVYSHSAEEHVRNLRALYRRLAEKRIILNLDKCVHGTRKHEILGMEVIPGKGVYPSPSETSVKKLLELRPPRTLTQLQALVGTCNWVLGRMLPHYADHMMPIQNILSEVNAYCATQTREELAKHPEADNDKKKKLRAVMRRRLKDTPVQWTPEA